MNNFSYQYYLNLISTIKSDIPIMDFSIIRQTTPAFFIIRHDVEFSVEKAYALAQLEHEILGIQSSYFFQIRNYAYNPFAFNNMKLIKQMYEMGHRIGLHVNTSGLTATDQIIPFIKNDVALLQSGLGIPIDRFSFHRPSHHLLELNLTIDGLINAYDASFFHFYKTTPPDLLKVHYFSDSEHQWKFGDPLSVLNQSNKKIQLLVHPYSWSEEGFNNTDNFKNLIQAKQAMMLQAMQAECRNFPKELLSHEKI